MSTVARYLFTEANDYGAGFDEGEADLIVSGAGPFRASYDRIETERLRIVVGQEDVTRVAYVKLRADNGLVTFPMTKGSTLIVRGEVVHFGELTWHGPGDRFHERISRHTKWCRIRLTPAMLWEAGRRPTPSAVLAPGSGHVIVLEPMQSAALLTAVNDAVALAGFNSYGAPTGAGESIEGALVNSIVRSLAESPRSPPDKTSERHHEIMLRLEDLLASRLRQSVQLPGIAAALQISERTLRTCCEEHLGLGLHRYIRLRRLKLVRHYLSRSNPRTTSVAAVARRYGFLELGRFAATYQHAFGELPSATLTRSRQSAAVEALQYGAVRTALIPRPKIEDKVRLSTGTRRCRSRSL